MSCRRNATTLFEVMTVVGVILVASAITIPFLKPMLTGNQVQAASDLVRSRWSEARARAIAEGRPYRFAYKENTSNFRLAPNSGEFWDDGDNEPANSTAAPLVIEGKLPGEVLFQRGSGAGSGDWTTAATFMPDGTAQDDVAITFSKDGAVSLTLRLQGSTGAITSGEPDKGH